DNCEADISVDRPVKDIALKARKTWWDRLSLATSRMTASESAQLTGQLYCMRASVARDVLLPREMLVEDGFIKALVCTDFLTRPSDPRRIVCAPSATHVFEAYTSPLQLLRNQKRQMIGQTIVHLLIDQELAGIGRQEFVRHIERREKCDPCWLQRLMAGHLRGAAIFG